MQKENVATRVRVSSEYQRKRYDREVEAHLSRLEARIEKLEKNHGIKGEAEQGQGSEGG